MDPATVSSRLVKFDLDPDTVLSKTTLGDHHGIVACP
jgi:hypothetical protein